MTIRELVKELKISKNRMEPLLRFMDTATEADKNRVVSIINKCEPTYDVSPVIDILVKELEKISNIVEFPA